MVTSGQFCTLVMFYNKVKISKKNYIKLGKIPFSPLLPKADSSFQKMCLFQVML